MCDNYSHRADFLSVLRCFLYLLTRLENNLWKYEATDYPQVIFDAIKDNPAYVERIRDVPRTEDKHWYLYWFSDYIKSIWTSPSFPATFAKMVDFLCEELQHERFGEARPAVMSAASSVRRVSNF